MEDSNVKTEKEKEEAEAAQRDTLPDCPKRSSKVPGPNSITGEGVWEEATPTKERLGNR